MSADSLEDAVRANRSPACELAVIRDYKETDREIVTRLGAQVIDGWHAKGPEASLHLVAELKASGEIAADLQATDAGVPAPSRRSGQWQFTLRVAAEHRRRGIGSALCRSVEAFARMRGARTLYTSYIAMPGAPAARFLEKRGFEPIETFYPSYLDLTTFDPSPFVPVVCRVESRGIVLTTYAEVGDSQDHRQKLYGLEQEARATQPFREVAPYMAEPFEKWENDFAMRDRTAVFLAISAAAGRWVGVVTGLEWYFTGVHPDWRGRGIATALKLRCIVEAKQRGAAKMETENHGDNLSMIAVNRKLGFVFTDPEIACLNRLSMTSGGQPACAIVEPVSGTHV